MPTIRILFKFPIFNELIFKSVLKIENSYLILVSVYASDWNK